VVLLFSQARDLATCAGPCSFRCESLQQPLHKAETLSAEQSFQISSGAATNVNPISLLSSIQDSIFMANQILDCDSTFNGSAEKFSDCLNVRVSNGLCIPTEIAKEIFSIPSSPTAISSLRSIELKSKTFLSASEEKNDSKLHPRCEGIPHHQVTS
jgi:hypothetical protein